MTNNLISLRRVNFAVIGLMLSFLFVLPILAQPTRPLPLSYERGMESAHGNLKTLEQLNSQIESDKSNVSLYKKRLQIYAFLRENYFDNVDKWKFYDVNLWSGLITYYRT